MSNWAQQQRMHFIGVCLEQYGYINRAAIMAMYGISMPQAATDLADFQELNPDSMVYNRNAKRYEPANGATKL